jgi:hypothetical protein
MKEYKDQIEMQFANSIKDKVLKFLQVNKYYDDRRIKAEKLAESINLLYNLKTDNRTIQNVKKLLIQDGIWIMASRSSKNGGLSICTDRVVWNKYRFDTVEMLISSIKDFGFKASLVNNDTVFINQN